MIPYYILVASPIIFSVLFGRKSENLENSKRQKIIMWIFFGILLAFLMLRYKSVGADASVYINSFERVSRMSWGEIFTKYEDEYGFWILDKIISIFTTNEQVYMAIMAICAVIPVAICYANNSENAITTMSIFLITSNFDMMFSGFRQAIAVGIIALSYKSIKEKKFWKFLIFVLIAFLFHKSALIALLLYPFYHMNITKFKLLFFVPVIGFVFVFNKQIFEFLLDFLGEYGENYEYEATGAYAMIILFALFVLLAYIAPKDENMDEEAKGLRSIAVLALMLQVFALASPVAMRMNYYFILFLPLMVPKIYSCCSDINTKAYKMISFLMTTFFIGYYFFNAHTGSDILQLYPYKFFFE